LKNACSGISKGAIHIIELESRQVKIHTAPLSMQIENWDEVQKVLRGTPYESFLYKD
jgi:hypothetical protein